MMLIERKEKKSKNCKFMKEFSHMFQLWYFYQKDCAKKVAHHVLMTISQSLRNIFEAPNTMG